MGAAEPMVMAVDLMEEEGLAEAAGAGVGWATAGSVILEAAGLAEVGREGEAAVCSAAGASVAMVVTAVERSQVG